MRVSPLMRRNRVSEINTYMLHNQLAVLSVRPCGAANKQQRYPFKRINERLRRKKNRAADETGLPDSLHRIRKLAAGGLWLFGSYSRRSKGG
jgi:hypothetical protein